MLGKGLTVNWPEFEHYLRLIRFSLVILYDSIGGKWLIHEKAKPPLFAMPSL